MKIVLLHVSAPFAKDSGAPLLRSVIPDDKIRKFIWCYADGRGVDDVGDFRCEPVIIPDVGGGLPSPLRSLLFRANLWGVVEAVSLKKSIKEAADNLRSIVAREKPTHLWGVAHLSLVPVLDEVASEFGGHVHLTVHDDPLFMLHKGGSRWPHKLRKVLEITYPRLLRRADSIDVVSPGLADHLLTTYGVPSLVFYSTPKYPLDANPVPPSVEQGFRVMVTGNWDCEREIAALCDGLRLAEKRGVINQPQIIYLHYNRRTVRAKDLPLFKFEEHRPESAAIELARTCHLLYTPYRFDPKSEPLQATSFPSKVSMYLPACRPLLFHGPPSSSTVRFSHEAGFGVPWTTLHPEDLPPLLEQVKTSVGNLSKFHADATRVADAYFNQSRNQRALWSALEGRCGSTGHVPTGDGALVCA